MLFNSLEFGAFFLIAVVAYFCLPFSRRALFLLLASCYFYMAFIPVYILILGGTIVVDYFAGLLIETSQGARRKAMLMVSLSANIGVLLVFKYCNFILDNISWLLNERIDWRLGILLPIGLSFHTFQAVSYTVEVYRGSVPAEKNFVNYAVYVMFFPQLVAGPIERPQNVLPQLAQLHRYQHSRVVDGLKLMAWGFFKKCVIADRLAPLVDYVYDSPHDFVGGFLLCATLFFAIQIYCDFSGYTDIALGSALILGIKLMKNFNHPYLAGSLSDFWRRWHISLSTWFKDYLYIPLGGNRVGRWTGYRNLIVTFLVSGLWHGASWNYVIWGGINGFFLVLESVVSPSTRFVGRFVPRFLWRIWTLAVVLLSWIFFRAKTLPDAMHILRQLSASPFALKDAYMEGMGATRYEWVLICFGLACLFGVEIWEEKKRASVITLLGRSSKLVRQGFYFLVVVAILLFGVIDSDSQFIYFQF